MKYRLPDTPCSCLILNAEWQCDYMSCVLISIHRNCAHCIVFFKGSLKVSAWMTPFAIHDMKLSLESLEIFFFKCFKF